jgi:hypothetical protein
MADHLKRSEAELGELLAEYWALRNRTCEWTDFQNVIKWLMVVHGSRIYGDYSQETGDAGLFRLSSVSDFDCPCGAAAHPERFAFPLIYSYLYGTRTDVCSPI